MRVLWLIIQDLKAMTDAAGPRPVVLINPRLKVWFIYRFISIIHRFSNFSSLDLIIFPFLFLWGWYIDGIFDVLGFTWFKWNHASKYEAYRFEWSAWSNIGLIIFVSFRRRWAAKRDWRMLLRSRVAISFAFCITPGLNIQLWVQSGKPYY